MNKEKKVQKIGFIKRQTARDKFNTKYEAKHLKANAVKFDAFFENLRSQKLLYCNLNLLCRV